MRILARAVMLVAVSLCAAPAAATLVVQMDFAETVKASTYVVRGTVSHKEGGWLETTKHRLPVTRYTLTIDKTYLGVDTPETLTITNPGGVQISPDLYAPMPAGFIDYELGTEMVIMLSPTSEKTFAGVGLHQGTYRIDKDKDSGEEVFVRLQGTVRPIDKSGQPTVDPLFAQREFTEAEFVAALASAAEGTNKRVRKGADQKASNSDKEVEE